MNLSISVCKISGHLQAKRLVAHLSPSGDWTSLADLTRGVQVSGRGVQYFFLHLFCTK